MKTRLLSFLAAVAAALTVIGGLDLSGLITLLPDNVAKAFTTILPLGAVIVHLAKTFGDAIDDGKINGSFKLVILGFICAGCMLLPSCAGIGSAITRTPVPTTPVKRVDGEVPFELATADVMRAEQDAVASRQIGIPPKAWGTYDAGLVAKRATEILDSGK